MSQVKRTVFPQQKIRQNFSDDYSALRKSLSPTEAGVFYMLADATCSTRPKVDIEKIHTDVFKRRKRVMPSISRADLETWDILEDSELMAELKKSREEMEKGRLIPWETVKATA